MTRRRLNFLVIVLLCCSVCLFLLSMAALWLMGQKFYSNIDEHASQLIDMQDFKYRMQLPACAAHIEALIVVLSAPANFDDRHLIRNTWGGELLRATPLRLIFLLAAVEKADVQQQLLVEQAQYGDMLQGSFIDDYRNLTYKHVMAFKWFVQHCSHAQLLIKADDDMFVNTPLLLQYWKRAQHRDGIARSNDSHLEAALLLFQQPRNLLLCRPKPPEAVSRRVGYRWYLSHEEYPASHFPPYCYGYTVIYSADVVARLFAAAQRTQYFWISDLHITGTLAQNCSIKITSWQVYENPDAQYPLVCRRKFDMYFPAYVADAAPETRALWQLYLGALNLARPGVTLPRGILQNPCGFLDVIDMTAY